MTLLTERCLGCVINIAYDRDISGEDDAALTCYHALVSRLTQTGYYPYRLGIQSMNQLEDGDSGYQTVLQTLKRELDPNQILAPERYVSMALNKLTPSAMPQKLELL